MKKNSTAKWESKKGVQNGAEPLGTVGLDLGDRYSHYCVLDGGGQKVAEGRVATEPAAMEAWLKGLGRVRIAMEVGTASPWVSRLVEGCGQEAIVGDARRVRAIWENRQKSDQVDAEMLARLARVDRTLLKPVRHRNEQAQVDLAMVRARDTLVRARTMVINTVRSVGKGMGVRLPKCSAECFAKQVQGLIPAVLHEALNRLRVEGEQLTGSIRVYDRMLEKLAQERYPETQRLEQIRGVGPVTSLAYVLTLEDPRRFPRSRVVGAYLGLTPRRDQSGNSDPQLPISKAGNEYLRRLLVSCAHYILGPFGEDSELRQWGLRLAERGGKNGKKRAVVAVARKLAVLLHRLWVTGAVYEPWPRSQRPAAAAVA